MRELNSNEIELVAGGDASQVCTPADANNYGGITNPEGIGRDIVNIYEGLVFATSHIIERVALALDN